AAATGTRPPRRAARARPRPPRSPPPRGVAPRGRRRARAPAPRSRWRGAGRRRPPSAAPAAPGWASRNRLPSSPPKPMTAPPPRQTMADPTFLPGLELSRALYEEAVRPILEEAHPDLRYAAARVGSGSEVLGFDSSRSAD